MAGSPKLTPPHPTLRFIAACVIGLFAAAETGAANPKYKQKAKPFSITLTTNVASANILEDGLAVAHSGESFDATLGVHALNLSAPGFIPRLILIRVDQAHPHVNRTVQMVQAPKKREIDLDFAKARNLTLRSDFATLPSLCQTFNSSPAAKKQLTRDLILPCKRKTILDDLSLFGLADLRAPANDGTPLAAIKIALIGRTAEAGTDEFYWQAEDLYSQAPGDEAAITLLAFSALRRNACVRTNQIEMELAPTGIFSPGLSMVRGFCLDLAGELTSAAAAFKAPIERKRSTPNAHYFLARSVLRSAASTAEATLRQCIKLFPNYYPCFEALAHVEALIGRQGAAQDVMKAYLADAARTVNDLLSRSGKKLDVNQTAIIYGYRPWIFELAAARLVTNNSNDPTGATLAVPLVETLVASPATVKKMVPYLEAVKQNAALETAYRFVLADAPNDVTTMIKLANIARNLDRCDESLDLSRRAVKLMTDSKRRAALAVSMAGCLIGTEKYDEAEHLLTEAVEDFPGQWKAQYNLGVVEQRLGKFDEAIFHLKMAAAGDVEPAMGKRIEEMITFIEAKRGQKGKSGKSNVSSDPEE